MATTAFFPSGVISKAKFADGLRDRRLPQVVEEIYRLLRLVKRVCSQRTAIARSRCTAMHRHTSRKSRMYQGKIAKGISDLPKKLLTGIFEHLGSFQGPVLMALDDKRLEDLPKAFRCGFILPSDRIHIRGEAGTDWDKHNRPQTRIPMILGLRSVCRNTFVLWYDNHMLEDSRSQNVWAISASVREDRYNLVDFKIRYKPILKDGLAQPFGNADEIGFDYEEVVHLGASHNTGKIIFDIDAPCDRTFVKKWINNQLFLHDGGHLAVRTFRLKFDPGTHARELSRQWLSDIFQHLHKRGVGRKTDSNTLVLDWNARDL
ncbi:hypothetical protein BKA58DRAFT_398078 [Alternaria rosae]|uniref:uncharacterized protein n=1 Tax=Alternaria rosae TaxID=1187941 RepID=UPI001E8DAB24|nr:uncharacterized protein BKA58DRAFT_398078 [Alternaria rosae]KAH6877988.1 hypothetical protein BKA58DRAFT_398078 [Alternaria rosae]